METQSQIYQFLRLNGLQEVRCEKHSTKPHTVSIITHVYLQLYHNTDSH